MNLVLPSTLNWFRKSKRKTFINFIFGLIGNNKVHDHEVFEMFLHQQRKSPKQLMLKEAESHVHTFVPFHLGRFYVWQEARQTKPQQEKTKWLEKTGPIFMTGPLLKCWIIDYIKPTSSESWDLQKLFDSSAKVKTNFKTEIKVARNERMWSQAWNPGFPSHKFLDQPTGQMPSWFPETKLFTWATILRETSKCTWDDIRKVYLSKSSPHGTLAIQEP